MGSGYRQTVQIEEDKLLQQLSKIYNKIQFDLDSGATWEEIQALYHKKTDDTIRSSVTAIYELSAKKTVERDIRIPYFLTQQDLNEIKRVSQKYQDSFWLGLNRELTMHNKMGVKTRYDPKTLLRIKSEDKRLRNGFVGRIAESVHGEAAAVGVLSKARQVVLQHQITNRIRMLQASTTVIDQYRYGQLNEPHLVWQTDNDACEECSVLQGSTYLLNDPATPIPSQDTHPRCRCELVLEDASLEEVEEASELFF